MLVLSRRAGEKIQIGEQIEVTVVRIGPGVVRIGIEAPTEMAVVREEIQRSFLPDSHQVPVQQAPDLTPNELETE
jgi:carbon storage regulator